MRQTLAVLLTGAALAAASPPSEAGPEITTSALEYRHGEVLLQGYIAYDGAETAKRPGVLIVHAWRGQDDFVREKARELASMGYVAFALDMYGKGVYAQTNQEAAALAGKYKGDRALLRARARAGLEVLRAHALVDPDRVAAIGFCFGGTTVLELARDGAPLRGVVSFHGGLETPMPARKGQVEAKVLVLHGGDDPLVPPSEVEAF